MPHPIEVTSHRDGNTVVLSCGHKVGYGTPPSPWPPPIGTPWPCRICDPRHLVDVRSALVVSAHAATFDHLSTLTGKTAREVAQVVLHYCGDDGDFEDVLVCYARILTAAPSAVRAHSDLRMLMNRELASLRESRR